MSLSFLPLIFQDGEDLQPDAMQPISSVVPVLPDEGIVAQLVTMGFPDIGSRKAATATGNSSKLYITYNHIAIISLRPHCISPCRTACTGAEAAMDWVLSHMEDPDFNVPLSTEAGASYVRWRSRLRSRLHASRANTSHNINS